MICVTCNEYYRKSVYDTTEYCDNCEVQLEPVQFDDEDQVEVNYLINPSGVTKAVYIE